MGTVKYIFKSLYSNKTIVQERHKPWYIAVIFFIVGCVLTWIPVIYSGYTTDNSSFFTGTSSQEVDRGLQYLLEQDYFQNGIIINQYSDGEFYLNFDGLDNEEYSREDEWNNEFDGVDETEAPLAINEFTDSDSSFLHSSYDATNKTINYYFDAVAVDTTDFITDVESDDDEEIDDRSVILEVYFLPDVLVQDDLDGDTWSQFLNNFISGVVLGTNSSGTVTRKSCSYIIFTPDVVSIAIAPINSDVGDSYSSSSTGYVDDGLVAIGATEYTTLYSALTDLIDGSDITSVFDAFASFFHNAVQITNIFSTWMNVAVLCGVVAGLELISSLFLFFMHRRRVSAFKETNFIVSLKEGMTLGFTPCLLGMIFGFLGFTYNLMLIIAGILLRTVWMNNKICPPASQDDKPLYKARS